MGGDWRLPTREELSTLYRPDALRHLDLAEFPLTGRQPGYRRRLAVPAMASYI